MTIHKEKGYNDIFRYDTDNALILEYVDGNEEESRRLHSLREGDEVRVTLDEKKNTISDNPERHGILYGRFRRIERKIDERGFMVPRAILAIYACDSKGEKFHFKTDGVPAAVSSISHPCPLS